MEAAASAGARGEARGNTWGRARERLVEQKGRNFPIGATTMRALTYQGPGRRTWGEVPDPVVHDPEDAVVRIDALTICGTDLHILKGDVPGVASGRVLGHEAVGTVHATGPGVRTIAPGERVVVPSISPRGRCLSCRRAVYGQCSGGGGWVLGHTADGTQAEYVRVPFADSSLHRIPDGVTDENALLVADVLPTAFEVAVQASGIGPEDSVAVIGAGPVGLGTVMLARLFSPRRIVVVGRGAERLEAAKRCGADATFEAGDTDDDTIRAAGRDGTGYDVVVEAVGTPEAFERCTRVVRSGGRIANAGVHGAPALLHLERLWSNNLTITTRLVDGRTVPTLLDLLADRRLQPGGLITHRFALDELPAAYDVFSQARASGALKVAAFRC